MRNGNRIDRDDAHRRPRVFQVLPVLLCLAIAAVCLGRPTVRAQTQRGGMSQADKAAFERALADVDAGRSQEAEPVLRGLAERYPANNQVNEALGLIYAEGGELQRALPYLERASKSAPGSALDHANLGTAWLKLGHGREAAAELKTAARLDPGNAATLSSLGQADMLLQDPVDAADAFSLATRLRPNDPDLLYNWAVALSQHGDNARAAEVLGRIPEKEMSDEAESLAGDVEEKLGHFLLAAQHDQRAAEKNPSEGNLYALSVEYLRHWTWAEAEKTAEFGAEKYPESQRVRLALGVALYGDKKFPEAARAFAELLEKQPDNATYAEMLGRTCGEVPGGNADCDTLEAFAAQHPDNGPAAVYAAREILEQPHAAADLETAERLLAGANARDPKMAEGWYETGVLDAERRQWQPSAEALEKATQLRPAYASAHYQLANAYGHLGRAEDRKKELALYRTYTEQEKNDVNARVREMTVFLTK